MRCEGSGSTSTGRLARGTLGVRNSQGRAVEKPSGYLVCPLGGAWPQSSFYFTFRPLPGSRRQPEDSKRGQGAFGQPMLQADERVWSIAYAKNKTMMPRK